MTKLILATTMLTAVAYAAAAEPTGFYAGAEYQRLAIDYQDYTVGGTTYNGDQVFADGLDAISPYAGYQFHPNVAVEASYIHSNEGEELVLFGPNSSEISMKGVTADLVGNYEFCPNWSVIGAAGVGYYEVDAEIKGPAAASGDETDIGYRAGAGIEYKLTDTVGLRSMARYTAVDFDDTTDGFTTFSLGAHYKF